MRLRPITFRHESVQPLPTTPRGHEVAMSFALRFSDSDAPTRCASMKLRPPLPGQILFIGGASGSGKSSLLRVVCRRAKRTGCVLNLRRIRLGNRPVIDLFDDPTFPPTLRRLCSVGLAEVWTWFRTPAQLSEGQRWRLRLALALQSAEHADRPVLLVCDEFAAVLDRVSATIVAACVRRAVDARPTTLAAILATSHDDLLPAIDPDVHVDCDFGLHCMTLLKRTAR